ncbi:hypothetical protein BAE44_0002413 [Dichanthelium oligosanthes]|uniref:DUF1618 domain-containing protein n=1 Tax=Dichanthelium oligosanthes TaxID=888268 RepID=A0A1E5WGS9_9POAL|nr:hypothetical protein BAE44_0002413 [Dichanthelium oligosanthes]
MASTTPPPPRWVILGLSNLKSLGLVSLPCSGGAEYIVAELRMDPGVHNASLVFFRSGAAAWAERKLTRPDMPGRTCLHWGWNSDNVIAHDGNLWWISLERGLLSCNPLDEHPVLRLDEFQRPSLKSFDTNLTVMWKQTGDAYKASKMPEQIPVVALISPTNPDHVFFFLDQYLFVVDVMEGQLVDYRIEELALLPSLQPPISWRYFMAWDLPSSLVTRGTAFSL